MTDDDLPALPQFDTFADRSRAIEFARLAIRHFIARQKPVAWRIDSIGALTGTRASSFTAWPGCVEEYGAQPSMEVIPLYRLDGGGDE